MAFRPCSGGESQAALPLWNAISARLPFVSPGAFDAVRKAASMVTMPILGWFGSRHSTVKISMVSRQS
ncbi:hypothetical protein X759_30225 [Mesorhizobium sp. LSHC420B00]|nr:hypothetical protein X759_30225 [Mesorhizobium sp. LSHC420B00]